MKDQGSQSENPDSLQEKVSLFREFLESQNARDPEVIDILEPDRITDCMIIVDATSRRHAQGLADGIAQICREKNFEFLGIEGYDLAEWILVDCNDVIINIFQEESRKLYKLEELWNRKPQHTRG